MIDRDDNIVNVCEIKFYNGTFSVDANYANNLRNKEVQFKKSTKTRKGINTIMLTTWGIEGKHAKGLVTNSLNIDCLFS
ncbi:hypothetical protein N9R81_04175 [Flavobacteriales bacterium]|nr:hypothetical protein [Flavobacteriales bacterium]